MVKKTPKKSKEAKDIYDFPLFSLFVFCFAFAILLFTLSPYFPPRLVLKPEPIIQSPVVLPPKDQDFQYRCPASDWIDCMPGPGPAKPQCQPEYLDWVQVNCPNFQGVAY